MQVLLSRLGAVFAWMCAFAVIAACVLCATLALPAVAAPAKKGTAADKAAAEERARQKRLEAFDRKRRRLNRSRVIRQLEWAAEEEKAPEDPHGLWVGVGTGFDGQLHEPEHAFGGGGTLTVGWRDEYLQVRLFSSVVGSVREVQRVGVEYGLGVAYPYSDWVDIGLYLGHRIASSGVTDAWLEQAWFLGIESAQRLWSFAEHTHLWIREGFSPVGQRWRRAESVDGELRALEQETRYQARFEVGLYFQQEIR